MNQKRLNEPVYTSTRLHDIQSFLFYPSHKFNDYIRPQHKKKIAKFACLTKSPLDYEIWFFFKHVVPVVILKLSNEDFISLVDKFKDQSNKYHSQELIMREYKPSKKNAYDKDPIPVYKLGYRGKMTLIKGDRDHVPEIPSLEYTNDYMTEIQTDFFNKHKFVVLKAEHISHLKNEFINQYEINEEEVLNEFKTFEHNFIKTIHDSQQSATGSNINVSMNMHDATLFNLNMSDTVNNSTEIVNVNEETIINEEDKNETKKTNDESKNNHVEDIAADTAFGRSNNKF